MSRSFLLTVKSFLLTVRLFYLRCFFLVFFTHGCKILVFFAYGGRAVDDIGLLSLRSPPLPRNFSLLGLRSTILIFSAYGGPKDFSCFLLSVKDLSLFWLRSSPFSLRFTLSSLHFSLPGSVRPKN